MDKRYVVQLDCYFYSYKVKNDEVIKEIKEFFINLQQKLGENKIKNLEVKNIYKQNFGEISSKKIY